jgi:hypothetical protein
MAQAAGESIEAPHRNDVDLTLVYGQHHLVEFGPAITAAADPMVHVNALDLPAAPFG